MSPEFSARRLAALLGDATPTAQQAAAIEASPRHPLLIVAGAGSGKTTTMASRVVWLIANGYVRPSEVLGLTFTRKAAGQLARKIRGGIARLGAVGDRAPVGEPTVSTYHSYASGIVTEHGPRAGIEPGATVLSATKSWQLAFAAASAHDGDMSQVSFGFSEAVRRSLSLADELAEHLRTADELREFTAGLREDITARAGRRVPGPVRQMLDTMEARLQLLPIVEEYHHRKRQVGAIDYADQLAQAAMLATTVPQVGRIERQRFTVVLLDEYQDTSHSQVTLLRALFGDGHPVTAVGDPCQSIYAWRGASAGTLSRFPTEFPDASGEPAARVELTRSWRNRAAILDVANAVSQPLRTAGLRVTALEPGADGDGEVTAALLETVDDEADWIAARVSALWSDNPDSPPSTAVLVRKRGQIAKLEEALRRAGLPVEVVGLGGLLDAPEVREIHAVLTVLARPTAGPALLRLLTGPRWRIGPRDVAALHARTRQLAPERRGFEPSAEGLWEVSLAEALDDPGEAENYSPAAWQRFEELRAELEWLRGRVDQPISDLIADITRVCGLDVEVLVHQRDTERLDAFRQVAANYVASAAQPSLDGFLSYLEAAEERERGLEQGGATEKHGAVQIMTVHAAKGLEWDCVAVPGLCEKVFPGTPRETNWLTAAGKLPYPLRGDAAELPVFRFDAATSAPELGQARAEFAEDLSAQHVIEERRLAYVALTRARWCGLASGYWWDAEATGPRGPSRFLQEVRDVAGPHGPWAPAPETGDNPLLADEPTATWPTARPLGDTQDVVEATAAAVREHDGQLPDSPPAARWAREAELLLAERQRAASTDITVSVPQQLSVSQLVDWHDDGTEFARRWRRPVPRPPSGEYSRRGTAFHGWVERHYQHPALFDMDDFADDEDTDADLETLREAFLASRWAERVPVAVEVPFVTVVRGVVVRGRMDAVFATDDGRYEVVDWKTGRIPRGAQAAAAAVQLAAYRKAWAALRGLDVSRVTAAFHYVLPNRTVYPAQLPELDDVIATD